MKMGIIGQEQILNEDREGRTALPFKRTFDLSEQTMDAYLSLFGLNDQNITLIEKLCNVNVSLQGNQLHILGTEKDTENAEQAIRIILEMISRHEAVDRVRIRYVVSMVCDGNKDLVDRDLNMVIAVTHRGKQVRCKTLGQMQYVNTILHHDLTFAIGPAGTGKTYLAMALAVVALKNKEVERIILTRPAVEAGEKLGFLPGDLSQKVDPYLRPLFDALYDFMGPDAYTRLVERGIVEVAPLAYMRGRTLSDAFIILDEAQNTTSEQMKMFLTRMGFRSRMVVTGDITQTDLPSGVHSGLEEAIRILSGIDSIGMVELTARDIVRHELVMQIIQAYEAGAGRGGNSRHS